MSVRMSQWQVKETGGRQLQFPAGEVKQQPLIGTVPGACMWLEAVGVGRSDGG